MPKSDQRFVHRLVPPLMFGVAAVLSGALMTGCSSGDAGACSPECSSGALCIDGRCAALCSSGSDCPGTQECMPEGFCRHTGRNNVSGQGDPPATDGTQCATDAGCDDGRPCTADACVSGACRNTPVVGSRECDDGDPCTTEDACTAGTCIGEALNCDDANPCTADACEAGSCLNVSVTEAVACDDGDPCTTADVCVAGECVGGGVTCDDANPCTADACVAGECQHTPVGDAVACDDDDPCTTADACIAGECIGASLDCDDANPCTSDTCAEGVCVNPPVANAIACDDGDPCTTADTCNGGACVGEALDCDDSNPCTSDECVDGACSSESVRDDTSCGDDLVCVSGECGAPCSFHDFENALGSVGNNDFEVAGTPVTIGDVTFVRTADGDVYNTGRDFFDETEFNSDYIDLPVDGTGVWIAFTRPVRSVYFDASATGGGPSRSFEIVVGGEVQTRFTVRSDAVETVFVDLPEGLGELDIIAVDPDSDFVAIDDMEVCGPGEHVSKDRR